MPTGLFLLSDWVCTIGCPHRLLVGTCILRGRIKTSLIVLPVTRTLLQGSLPVGPDVHPAFQASAITEEGVADELPTNGAEMPRGM